MPNPIKIHIVGVGSIGERHLRCFQATGRCVVSFSEPIPTRRDQVVSRYGVNGYETWQRAFDQEPFSAAVIASPAPWHIPIAEEMTQRGVHLLIEKPLSLNLDGIPELTAMIDDKSTRVAVAFTYRAMPALQEMRAAILSGRFGKPVQIQVQSGQHFPFYRPAYREIYYADPNLGGGLIQDMLPHHLNAIEWIVGPTHQVVADSAHQVLSGVEVEDTVNVLARNGDVMTSLTLNQHQPVNESTVTLLCESGAVRWELHRQRWLSASENGGDWKQEDSFDHQRDDFYVLQANAFIDYLQGNAAALCSLDDGVQTLKSTLAVLQSRRSGNWVTVNAVGGKQ